MISVRQRAGVINAISNQCLARKLKAEADLAAETWRLKARLMADMAKAVAANQLCNISCEK